MARETRGYVELGDGRLYYEVAGDGEPLVLSHAGFVDSRMWDSQWDEFTRYYRVVRFDMRGYGQSDPVEGPRVRRHDLYGLLDHLTITRATLMGCSASGEMMLDMALERPELVSALALVSTVPSGFVLQGEPPRYLLEMLAAMEQGELKRASELQNRIWIDGPFRQPDQVDPRVRQRAAEMNRIPLAQGTWRKADVFPLNPLDPPAVQRLYEVRVPTLIIAGALDHPEIIRAANLMAEAIPGARQVMMADCAHIPNMEQPERFNHVVLDFLRGLT